VAGLLAGRPAPGIFLGYLKGPCMNRFRIVSSAVLLIAFAAPWSRARADNYQVDPVHSTVLYRVKHFNTSYSYGRFNELTGNFSIDESNPSGSAFDLAVKADSLDSNNKARDKHLKSPDFFNVKEFPTLSFKSNQITRIDDQNLEVKGDLTIHGVTNPVTIHVERTGLAKGPGGKPRIGLHTTFTIKRSDFGMKNMLQGIGDDVGITVAIEGVRQ
jgi:polyisoprenoid-binding protein YceI